MTESYDFSTVEREINERGNFASTTKGVSMRPLFRTGRDMIVVSRVERPLKKYDIILYRGGDGEYILHRIIGIRKDFFVVRGDNNYFKEKVTEDRIIGVLTSFNRKGKSGTPDSFSFRLCSRVWRYIYPLRYFLMKTKFVFSKLKRKFFKKK